MVQRQTHELRQAWVGDRRLDRSSSDGRSRRRGPVSVARHAMKETTMESSGFTRRALLGSGVAAAVTLAAGGSAEGDAAPMDDVKVGVFVAASGDRSAVVRLVGSDATTVVDLDSTAFLAHGTDGIVASVTAFVPGEEVVFRAVTSRRGVVATEFQSMYHAASGRLSASGSGLVLATDAGDRVEVPKAVADRDGRSRLSGGATVGSMYGATVWTDPRNGKTTALMLDDAD